MIRITLRLVLSLALVAAGWFVGLAHARSDHSRELFRLTIDAPAGDSATVRCNGCSFLYWQEGHSTLRKEVTLTCDGAQPCTTVIGGTITTQLLASNR